MIKFKPITFTGNVLTEEITRQKRAAESPIPFDESLLDKILGVRPKDVDSSSLHAIENSYCYNIGLKDGNYISSIGNDILQVSRIFLNKNPKGIKREIRFQWTLNSKELNRKLKAKFQAAIKHLDEIWIKVPEDPSKIIPRESAVKPATSWKRALGRLFKKCLLISS